VLLTLLAFVIVIGPLILVHELGHFMAAKATGVQVLRFSIGFGPPIVSWRRGETEYRLAWIPLGGYVKMAGLEDEGAASGLEGGPAEVAIDPERAFDRKPVAARVLVLIAGVTMNVILAFLIYAGLYALHGTPRLATTQIDSVSVSGLPAGAESLRELRFGDQIVRVNGAAVRSWDDVVEHIVLDTLRTDIAIDLAGRSEPLVAQIGEKNPAARRAIARSLAYLIPPRIGMVNPGEPAARAGLRVGDVVARINGDSVRSWSELSLQVRHNPAKEVKLDVVRGDTTIALTLVPKVRGPADTLGGARPGEGMMGALGSPARFYVPEAPGRAIVLAVDQTLGAAGAIFQFLGRLVSGNEPLKQLGGPVLIGQISGQVIRLGLHDFLAFIAFFSVQLAVLNLLPIPVLDGGHLVFLLAESVRGRPIPINVRIRLLNIGFWILIAIMVVAFGNDVFRILPR
jgi:regulator of sigma E protease